ncbi:MAG TPA: hypothetical protein VJY41_09120 [Prolixibacteraceae bacterium]|nr:hypothetical protein [Prolixibacteraceae bacterium]
MIEYLLKIPSDKEKFFVELIQNLGFDYEKILSSNDNETDSLYEAEEYFTDDDV